MEQGKEEGGRVLEVTQDYIVRILEKRFLLPTWLSIAGRHGLLQPGLQVHLVGWLRERGRREEILKEIRYVVVPCTQQVTVNLCSHSRWGWGVSLAHLAAPVLVIRGFPASF